MVWQQLKSNCLGHNNPQVLQSWETHFLSCANGHVRGPAPDHGDFSVSFKPTEKKQGVAAAHYSFPPKEYTIKYLNQNVISCCHPLSPESIRPY